MRLYWHLTQPKYENQPELISEEIDRTIRFRNMIFDELDSLDAPHKIFGQVASQLMNRWRKQGETLQQHTQRIMGEVRDKTVLFEELRSNMLAKGHHETVAGEVAVKCLFMNDPYGGARQQTWL